MKEIINKIKELDRNEAQYLLYCLLLDGTFSYADVSSLYVESLKEKQKESYRIMNGMAYPLSVFLDFDRPKKYDKDIAKTMRHKGILNMLKSGVFRTAQIETIWKKELEEVGASLDEDGMLMYKTKSTNSTTN